MNERIVGFGRAISDDVFNAAIYDVVVHRDYQKLGIGQMIVQDLLERLSHISCVHLISTMNNELFYQKLGFKKTKTGMARYISLELDQHYLES